MPHATIEYAIILPALILQIFLFPMTANWLMNTWVDSRRNLILQDVAGQIGSTVQQLYLALSHETVSAGTVTNSMDIPALIEDSSYIGNVALKTALDENLNSSKVMMLTLKLQKTETSVTTSIVLGPNVLPPPPEKASFGSTNPEAVVVAEKFPNGSISIYFGG